MSIFDRIFKDKDGKVVIGQIPNLPIITYVVALSLSKLTEGYSEKFFETVSFGALFVFAWLELFDGVNYFRRFLGFVVLVFMIYNKVN